MIEYAWCISSCFQCSTKCAIKRNIKMARLQSANRRVLNALLHSVEMVKRYSIKPNITCGRIHRKLQIKICNTFSSKCVTYDNIVVATVALTTLRACPILIPNVCAIWHIFSTNFRAQRLGGTALRNVKLFQSAQSEVRMTSPTNLRQTHIFARFACFNRVQTLFCIFCLIWANIAFHGSTCECFK